VSRSVPSALGRGLRADAGDGGPERDHFISASRIAKRFGRIALYSSYMGLPLLDDHVYG
jgi:hypothetical protein